MLVPSDPNNYTPLGKAVNLGHLPFVTAVTHAFRLGFLKAFLPLQFGKNVFRTCLSLQQMANSCVSVPDDSSSPVNVNWTMCACVCLLHTSHCLLVVWWWVRCVFPLQHKHVWSNLLARTQSLVNKHELYLCKNLSSLWCSPDIFHCIKIWKRKLWLKTVLTMFYKL